MMYFSFPFTSPEVGWPWLDARCPLKQLHLSPPQLDRETKNRMKSSGSRQRQGEISHQVETLRQPARGISALHRCQIFGHRMQKFKSAQVLCAWRCQDKAITSPRISWCSSTSPGLWLTTITELGQHCLVVWVLYSGKFSAGTKVQQCCENSLWYLGRAK